MAAMAAVVVTAVAAGMVAVAVMAMPEAGVAMAAAMVVATMVDSAAPTVQARAEAAVTVVVAVPVAVGTVTAIDRNT